MYPKKKTNNKNKKQKKSNKEIRAEKPELEKYLDEEVQSPVKEWRDLMNWAHEVLAPLFEQLGWVTTEKKGKKGWRYRVAGGSYLLYLQDCLPQTWHLDSPDPNSISVILPITENCPMTDFAVEAHQPRKVMYDIMKKAGWTTWLKSEDDLQERLDKLPSDLAQEVLADMREHFVYAI